MSATRSIRPALQARLAELLSAKTELTGVRVVDGVDPRGAKDEEIIIGKITGVEAGVRDMRGGRKSRKDVFDVEIDVYAYKKGQRDPAAAKARALEMFGPLEDILAGDPTLGALPGLTYAELGSSDGPDSTATNEGFVAKITARVRCNTELF